MWAKVFLWDTLGILFTQISHRLRSLRVNCLLWCTPFNCPIPKVYVGVCCSTQRETSARYSGQVTLFISTNSLETVQSTFNNYVRWICHPHLSTINIHPSLMRLDHTLDDDPTKLHKYSCYTYMAAGPPLRLEGNLIFWASGWPYFSLLSFALSRYLFCE